MAATYNEFAATTLRSLETKATFYFHALRSTSLQASRVALVDLRAVALDIDDSPSLPKLSEAAFEVVDSYLRTSAVPRAPPPLVEPFPARGPRGARGAGRRGSGAHQGETIGGVGVRCGGAAWARRGGVFELRT